MFCTVGIFSKEDTRTPYSYYNQSCDTLVSCRGRSDTTINQRLVTGVLLLGRQERKRCCGDGLHPAISIAHRHETYTDKSQPHASSRNPISLGPRRARLDSAFSEGTPGGTAVGPRAASLAGSTPNRGSTAAAIQQRVSVFV